MAYLFNTPEQQQEMLSVVGQSSIEDLFSTIPAPLRLSRDLDLPPALSEMELDLELRALAERSSGVATTACFMGGGAYDHFIPAAVDELAGRGEFYTAYTPYQAEASQGSLQVFFEFQSLICQLTGMEVSNASLYEGGTAVSEAAFMAMRVTNRHSHVVVAGSVNPEFQQILRTYTKNLECEVECVPAPDGTVDPAAVAAVVTDKTACVVVQHPNFFGCLEDVHKLAECAHAQGALFVVSFDPISLGLLERPGDYGADIAVAEGQSLGIPLQYGGPYLGILACREKFMRKMPGRLIGEATDRNGKRCFILNLQAREQHIRRDKATSNICTNQGLLALRATIHMSLLGPEGMRDVATLCCQKTHYAAQVLTAIDGVELVFQKPFFREFLLRCSGDTSAIQRELHELGFDVGPATGALSVDGEAMPEGLLVAATECRTRGQIDALAATMADLVTHSRT